MFQNLSTTSYFWSTGKLWLSKKLMISASLAQWVELITIRTGWVIITSGTLGSWSYSSKDNSHFSTAAATSLTPTLNIWSQFLKGYHSRVLGNRGGDSSFLQHKAPFCGSFKYLLGIRKKMGEKARRLSSRDFYFSNPLKIWIHPERELCL